MCKSKEKNYYLKTEMPPATFTLQVEVRRVPDESKAVLLFKKTL